MSSPALAEAATAARDGRELHKLPILRNQITDELGIQIPDPDQTFRMHDNNQFVRGHRAGTSMPYEVLYAQRGATPPATTRHHSAARGPPGSLRRGSQRWPPVPGPINEYIQGYGFPEGLAHDL